MKSGTWKRYERWWADKLGGRRNPVTGRTSGDVADVEHPRYAIEVKAGKVISARLRKAFSQVTKAAETHTAETQTTQLRLVCITQTDGPGIPAEHYVAMPWDDFEILHQYLDEVYFDPDEFRNYLEGNKIIEARQAKLNFDTLDSEAN